MNQRSLEDILHTTSPVDLLRNSKIGACVYRVVPSEYTNWRDEQRAWRDSCVLFDLSLSNHASASFDKIVRDGHVVGASMFAGYRYNERAMLSLGIADPDVAIGDEVTLVWGEEGGGSAKTTVERHEQIEIRAVVSPTPYSKVARETCARGWRNRAAR